MCSKRLEKEIHALLALVSEFNPEESPGDGYIEEVEASAPTTPTPLKPALPPPVKAPNIFERTFSFSGETRRGYYFWNTLCLAILSIIVATLIDEGTLEEGWGVLFLALGTWSILATTVKRWRDTGHNMWWMVTLFIPYVGFITTLFILFSPSKHDP